MRRRDFITVIASAAAAWPLDLRAQEPGRTYRLGGLTPSPRDAPHYVALFDELRRLGFIEGQNLTLDWRGYGLRPEQFPDIAMELVKAKADVIFAPGMLQFAPHNRRQRRFRYLRLPTTWWGQDWCARWPSPAATRQE